MNKETQSLITLLIGGALLRISVTDVYLRYVKEGLRPFLIVSAVALLVIGAATLWREMTSRTGGDHADKRRRRRGEAEHDNHDHDEHGHSHGAPWAAWLLVLPVFAIFLIAPPSLGSYAAQRTGTSVTAPAANSDYPPLPAGENVPLTVLDYATRAVFERGASLSGRTVTLTGFTSPREGGGVRLTRMILTCCAADGRPVKITLSGDLPSKLKADTWVQVTGTYDKRLDNDSVNGEKIPYFKVDSLKRIPKPAQPYEE